MFERTCREVTRLVLEGEDRRLRMNERLSVLLHLQICTACSNFVEQVAVMRKAMRRWRSYAEKDADEAAKKTDGQA